VAVWTLILQSEPEGPALISCAARLLRSDSTFANLLLAPSWRTDLCHLECDIAAMAHDLRANLDQLFLQARQRPVFDRLWRRQGFGGLKLRALRWVLRRLRAARNTATKRNG